MANSDSSVPAGQVNNLEISDHQPSTGGGITTMYKTSTYKQSATLTNETLRLRISEARETFIPTNTFKHVSRTLDQFGYVTLCGIQGEGKTTMSLMLARYHMRKGYDVFFVQDVEEFDFNDFISSSHRRRLLIVDGVFGSVRLTTNTSQLRHLFMSLKNSIQEFKKQSAKTLFLQVIGNTQQQDTDETPAQETGPLKQPEIRVVFTTDTYNFQEGISKLKLQTLSLFARPTVIDLTSDKGHCYSVDEKIEMFEKHKSSHPDRKTDDISIHDVVDLSSQFVGFPLTCKLFFEYTGFRCTVRDFFKRPMFYVRMELSNLLRLNNNKTAALILMLLCDGKLHLADLENPGPDQAVDDRIKRITDITSPVTRQEILMAARGFRGTIFSGEEVLTFSHPSIYSACAGAMFNINPRFVLHHFSISFLYDHLKSKTMEETKASDSLHFLSVSGNDYNQIATRMLQAMMEGQFSKTLTHPLLVDDVFAEILIQKLKGVLSCGESPWINQKDKGKGFLFWAVQGPSNKLVQAITDLICSRLVQNDIVESLDGCVEKDNLVLLKLLLNMLEKDYMYIFPNLLLLSGEKGSWEIARHLLKEGVNIHSCNKNKQNFFHLICDTGRSNMLKLFISEMDTLVRKEDYLSALNSVDITGRTPAVLATLCGSGDCFTLIAKDSKLDTKGTSSDKIIHLAAWEGNTDILQHVITPFYVNSRGENGWTPVMYAVVGRHKVAFDLLVSNNADFTLRNDSGNSLIHLACQGGDEDIVQQVLKPTNINTEGKHGWTPVMKAAVHGHQNVYDLLVAKGADLTHVDDYGNSLLHLACAGGNKDIAKHVLTFSDINIRGQNGLTAVMIAAVNAQQEVVEFLISDNADLDLVDFAGDNVVHLACQGGNRDIVQQVLTPSNINSRGDKSWTPVMTAAAYAQESVFNLLVLHNADLTMVDDSGDSLIHLACQGGSRDIVKQILTPSNINSRGEEGITPLMYAVACRHQNVVDLLMSNNPDLSLADDTGDTLIHLACKDGNKDIVELILTPSNINSRGEHGWTPIMNAAALGHQSVFDLLVSNNADLTLLSDEGDSLLHLACQSGNIDIVQRVMTKSNINSKGNEGTTPMMYAACFGHRNIIDLLMENHADLALVDKHGFDVTDYAEEGGQYDVSEYLKTVLS